MQLALSSGFAEGMPSLFCQWHSSREESSDQTWYEKSRLLSLLLHTPAPAPASLLLSYTVDTIFASLYHVCSLYGRTLSHHHSVTHSA